MADTLEELVRAELREPVAQLVRRLVPEIVAEQLARTNGVAPESAPPDQKPQAPAKRPPGPAPTPRPAVLVCRVCTEEKPSTEFQPNRRVCRVCRSRRADELAANRAAAANAGPPHNRLPSREAVAATAAGNGAAEVEAARAGLRGPRAQQLAQGQRRHVGWGVSELEPAPPA